MSALAIKCGHMKPSVPQVLFTVCQEFATRGQSELANVPPQTTVRQHYTIITPSEQKNQKKKGKESILPLCLQPSEKTNHILNCTQLEL